MGRRPNSVNLRKIKISDIKTVIFFTTFNVIYTNADNNIIIPQAHKGMPYRNPSSFVHPSYGLLKTERMPFSVNLRKIKTNDIITVIFCSTFKAIYFKADSNIMIPQAHKGMPYRNSSSFDQVMCF